MPATYTPIQTQILSASAGSVTFSSIPNTYTDLVLVTSLSVVTGADNVKIRFNGDTGSNYATIMLNGNGTTANSGNWSNESWIRTDYYAYPQTTTRSTKIFHFNNYSNTTTFKNALCTNTSTGGVEQVIGLWRSTAAINSITFTWSLNFAAGSTFSLYGIKAA